MKLRISTPNDYKSEAAWEMMAKELRFGELLESGFDECDLAQQAYEEFAVCAKEAGLEFLRQTDYGAEWTGTSDQILDCIASLPRWAYPSVDESDGDEDGWAACYESVKSFLRDRRSLGYYYPQQ